MAITHFKTGAALIKFGDAANLVDLGYTRDGVQYRIEPKVLPIPSDDFGGEGGEPSDEQLLGAGCVIQAELTKYEQAQVEKLTSFDGSSAAGPVFSATAGVLPAIGSCFVADGLSGTLVISTTSETKTFNPAWLRYAHEANSGTRYRSYVLGWYCRIDAASTRVLFVNS